MLKVACLTDHFHSTNNGLAEVLHDKNRGYGIVTISINGLTFGIPLRTNLQHQYGVTLDTIYKDGRNYKRGLDFTKAVLIKDIVRDVGGTFYVSPRQKECLKTRKKMIINQFNKYVQGYVNAVNGGVSRTLAGPAYKYSTLVNYHTELCL